ncbi:allergen Arg r 1-like isoform X2 [Ornithodoros turicata]|uniref:allergen Arg r 1-like isoform X2 n=1 Tax=Ornithodoros turicata TaxID=34597 RepID=UPI003139F9F9
MFDWMASENHVTRDSSCQGGKEHQYDSLSSEVTTVIHMKQQTVVYLLVFCIICGNIIGAYSSCPTQMDAWTTIKSAGWGRYFLVKSTSRHEAPCTYMGYPSRIKEGLKNARIVSGALDRNKLFGVEDKVTAKGDRFTIGYLSSKVLFADYGNCAVIFGPTQACELWVHEAILTSSSYGCCDTNFQGCAKRSLIHHHYQQTCPK